MINSSRFKLGLAIPTLNEAGNIVTLLDGLHDAMSSMPIDYEFIVVDEELLRRSLEFFGTHTDKSWGLVDCASFIVMRDRGITHYEWLCNLEELLDKGEFEFTGLLLRIGNGSGSPVRAIAVLH